MAAGPESEINDGGKLLSSSWNGAHQSSFSESFKQNARRVKAVSHLLSFDVSNFYSVQPDHGMESDLPDRLMGEDNYNYCCFLPFQLFSFFTLPLLKFCIFFIPYF